MSKNEFKESLIYEPTNDNKELRDLAMDSFIELLGEKDFEQCVILCEKLNEFGWNPKLSTDKDALLIYIYNLIKDKKYKELSGVSECTKVYKSTLKETIYRAAKEVTASGQYLGKKDGNEDLRHILNAAIFASDLSRFFRIGLDAESLILIQARTNRQLNQDEESVIKNVDEVYRDLADFAVAMTNEEGKMSLSVEEIQQEKLDVKFANIIKRLKKAGKEYEGKKDTEIYIDEMGRFHVWYNKTRISVSKEENK